MANVAGFETTTREARNSSPAFSASRSNKEVNVGFVGLPEIRRYTCIFDVVEKFLLLRTEDIHRHRAGDELDSLFAGGGHVPMPPKLIFYRFNLREPRGVTLPNMPCGSSASFDSAARTKHK